MYSINRSAANRANSDKSSGPKSAGGKLRSSINALKHGLRSNKFVIIHEDAEEYEDQLQRFFRDWKPHGITEKLEVVRLAQILWQLQRAELAFTESLDTEICKKLDGVTEQRLQKTIHKLERLGNPDRGKLDAKESKKIARAQATYSSLVLVQERVRETMSRNIYGVGAALVRLGSSADKLGTILRYMAHLRSTEQRILQNLILLQARQKSTKSEDE
jgi:hypothetical protein